MITSRIKVGHPERLFRYGDEDEKKMQVQFARLCVLYDDLTLEFTAANQDAIPLLDKSGRDNRRLYFVRRTLGTLSELRGAIGALEKSTTFQARKGGLGTWRPEGMERGRKILRLVAFDVRRNWPDDLRRSNSWRSVPRTYAVN